MNYQVICEQDIVNKLSSFAKEAKEKIWIATPYIGDFKTVSSVLGRNWQTKRYQKGIRFLVDVEESAEYGALLEIEKFAEIRTLRGLHAKIYIFDEECIVSSANLTKTSLSKRYEAAVILKTDDNIGNIFEKWWKKSKPITSKMLNKKTERSLVEKEKTVGDGLRTLWHMPPATRIGKFAQTYSSFLKRLNQFKVNYQKAVGQKQLTEMPLFLEIDNFFNYLYEKNKRLSRKYKDSGSRELGRKKIASEIKKHLKGYKEYLNGEEGERDIEHILERREILIKILRKDITKENFLKILAINWTWQANKRFHEKEIEENKEMTIKKAFNELLHGKDDVDLRIKQCTSQIKGIGKGTISEILAFYDSDKYPVMNKRPESGLRYFGYDI